MMPTFEMTSKQPSTTFRLSSQALDSSTIQTLKNETLTPEMLTFFTSCSFGSSTKDFSVRQEEMFLSYPSQHQNPHSKMRETSKPLSNRTMILTSNCSSTNPRAWPPDYQTSKLSF
jgi:hypothetical protein